jgi:hypothetical protein
VAESGGSGIEDELVYEIAVEEGGVEGSAGFDEDAEDFAGGECGEDGVEVEGVAVGIEADDFCASGEERGFSIGGGRGAAEEEGAAGIAKCGDLSTSPFDFAQGFGRDDVVGGWCAEIGIEDDAQERTAAGKAGAVGEGGVVGEDGADAGENGV